ncbi:MAG: endonuclease III [Candidatus Gracilibacteria bacterium]
MIDSLLKILDQVFPNPQPSLRHRSVFELLLAVILSTQCTDERVNKITPLLFPKDRPCTPEDILTLGESEVKRIIHPCGYFNSKTKAIMGCAVAIQVRGGGVPSNFSELTSLPGVGAKTAQVIQSQWYKLPAFPVDTHIHRVCNRLGIANSGTNRDKTERQVKAAVPRERWSKLHLQLIFHGRKTCTAYKPKCQACPLYELCQWPDKRLFMPLRVMTTSPNRNDQDKNQDRPPKDC